MEDRTLEIIAVCKGRTKYDSELGLVDAVKNYMSDTCACKKEWYTDSKMEEILKEAFYDFIDTCDRPSYFLKRLEEVKWISLKLTDRICMVFQMIQICRAIENGYQHINGFDENYEKIAKDLRQ